MYLKIKTKSDLVHSFSFEFSFYSFKKNLKYTKTVLNMTDTMLSGFLDISRMSLSRYLVIFLESQSHASVVKSQYEQRFLQKGM